MDTAEILVFSVAALLIAIFAAWLLMKLILSGMAKRIMTQVREFIERARRDRRRIPRDTPDRRGDAAKS